MWGEPVSMHQHSIGWGHGASRSRLASIEGQLHARPLILTENSYSITTYTIEIMIHSYILFMAIGVSFESESDHTHELCKKINTKTFGLTWPRCARSLGIPLLVFCSFLSIYDFQSNKFRILCTAIFRSFFDASRIFVFFSPQVAWAFPYFHFRLDRREFQSA